MTRYTPRATAIAGLLAIGVDFSVFSLLALAHGQPLWATPCGTLALAALTGAYVIHTGDQAPASRQAAEYVKRASEAQFVPPPVVYSPTRSGDRAPWTLFSEGGGSMFRVIVIPMWDRANLLRAPIVGPMQEREFHTIHMELENAPHVVCLPYTAGSKTKRQKRSCLWEPGPSDWGAWIGHEIGPGGPGRECAYVGDDCPTHRARLCHYYQGGAVDLDDAKELAVARWRE